MPDYRVIAEFIDLESGRRHFPGETVNIKSPARVRKLADIGVINPDPVEPAAQAVQADAEEQEDGRANVVENEDDGQPQATAEEQPGVVFEEEKPVKAKAKAK